MAYGVHGQTSLNIDIRTGDDDMQISDFQKNPEIVIVLADGREIRKVNINRESSWVNNSLNRVIIDLPEGVRTQDVSELRLYRTKNVARFRTFPTENLKKDNWTLKAMRVTASVREGGRTKTIPLIDLNPRGGLYRFVFDDTTNPGEGQMYRTSLTPLLEVIERKTDNAIVTATFGTGNDDLRGRGDNVTLILRSRRPLRTIELRNMNSGVRWADGSEHTITKEIPDSAGMGVDDINEVILRHDGGQSNDEWVLNKLRVTIKTTVSGPDGDLVASIPETKTKLLVDRTDASLYRFKTGERQTSFSLVNTAGQVALKNAKITAEFTTGDDDLRGGDDNVNLILHFKSSPRVLTPARAFILQNINNGASFPNRSTIKFTDREFINSSDINIDDIDGVEIQHTRGRGDADNWDLTGLKVTITKDGRSRVLVDNVSRLLFRFTGSRRSKVFPVE